MVRLRHISGDNLSELEKALESYPRSIIITQITMYGSTWFIHFLEQPNGLDDKQKVTKVEAKKTITK